jgi:hypothetical protein
MTPVLIRMLSRAAWLPDGYSVVQFGIGEIVSSLDPRAGNGFITVALQNGWAERLHADEGTPARLRSSGIIARSAPATKAKRMVERTK